MVEHASLSWEGEAQCTGKMLRSDVRYVLGVAFPCTDVDAPRNAELEHTFLRLAYAVYRLSRSGASVAGYFAVLRQEVRDAVQRLQSRFEVGDSVHIVFTSLLVSDMTRLAAAAEAASKEADPSVLTSVARQIAMETLRREIALREPGVVESSTQDTPPFGVQWDFYGQASAPDAQTAGDSPSCPRLI